MKILIAVDGSKHGDSAALKALELLDLNSNSEVFLLSVADDVHPMGVDHLGISAEFYTSYRTEVKAVAEGIVERVKRQIENKSDKEFEVRSLVEYGSPKTKIVEVAKESDADVIVMGSHGYGMIERVLLGSVSQAVLNSAHCPVLIMRPE